jgi:mRNA interferase HigB
MEVNLIRRATILDYVAKNPMSSAGFTDWLSKIDYADWEIPGDIKKTYSSADLLGEGSDRVVFDIGGNKHRMVCTYSFRKKRLMLYVNWIGTHQEYDVLNKNSKGKNKKVPNLYSVDDHK